MAIEFNCPYCTAAIRVPDEFSGKRGSCPKCATKLIVPDVVPRTGTVAAVDQQPPASPTPAVGVPDSTTIPEASPVPQETPSSMSRSLRKKRRHGKSMRVAGMIIAGVCFLAFLGVLSLVFLLQVPELKGSLSGHLAANMEIPTVNVPLTDLGLSGAEQEAAILAFRGKSESFVSVQMTCAVELNGQNLAIDVLAGEEFSLFAVNPTTDVILGAWIRQNKDSLGKKRLSQATSAGADLCRDKIARAAGTSVELAAEHYRDNFALSYQAGAFGSVVEAVTGKRRSFCTHEDTNGTLYFILPKATTKFLLRGRSFDGGVSPFPGEYRVVVSGSDPGADDASEPEEPEEPVGAPIEALPMDGESDASDGEMKPSDDMGMDNMEMSAGSFDMTIRLSEKTGFRTSGQAFVGGGQAARRGRTMMSAVDECGRLVLC